jgi:anaerobic magnesium-protoporphyrin IX monomethyl ester cyclase
MSEYFWEHLASKKISASPQVVLVNPPLDVYEGGQTGIYKTLPPFGLGYLATISDNAGISTVILDCEALRLSLIETTELIDKLSPSILGFTITSPSMNFVKDIMEIISPSDMHVIAGGAHPTALPETMFSDIPSLDAIFLGPAEDAWLSYITQVFSSTIDYKSLNIRGVCTKYQHEYTKGISTDLDMLPFVNRKFFVNDPYPFKDGFQSAILSSRGCPFNCGYCAASAFTENKVSFRSIGNLVDEIEILANEGVQYFHFADDNFTISSKRIQEFALEVQFRKIAIKWKSFSRSENIDPKNIGYLLNSGCYKLTFGVESGSDRVLNMMNKRQTIASIQKAITLCKINGIETKGFFMLGYPGETKLEMEETVQFAIKLELDSAFFYVVRAFPGTALYSDLLSAGFSEESLLQYQHTWPKIRDMKLTHEQSTIADKLKSSGVFDFNKTLKYNVTHLTSIHEDSISELCEIMSRAYVRFYFREEYLAKHSLPLIKDTEIISELI